MVSFKIKSNNRFTKLRFRGKTSFSLIALAAIVCIGTIPFCRSPDFAQAELPGTQWTRNNIGGGNFYNNNLASSTDGMTLVGAEFLGYVYTSTNGGQTWTQRAAGGTAPGSWRSIAISGDGTKMIAGTNGNNLFTSTDGGATWTQRSPAGGATLRSYQVAISGDGSTWVAARTGYIYVSTDNGATWSTGVTPTGATTSTGILFAKASNDGTRIVVGGNNDYIYTSTNRGVGWTQRNPAGTGQVFRAGAMSADGTKITVAARYDYVYTSTDGGVNWMQQSQLGSSEWIGVAMSTDGTKIATIEPTGSAPVNISNDGGASWTTQMPYQTGSFSWRAIAMSGDGAGIAISTTAYTFITGDSGATWVARNPTFSGYYMASSTDGTRLAVSSANRGYVYVSADSGASWTQYDPTGTGPTTWRGMAMSADGTKLFTLAGHNAYVSTDGGATWNSYVVAGHGGNWRSIASSADGMKLVAVSYQDYAYTSTDGGQTWTQRNPAGGTRVWQNAASSADGTKLVATISDNAAGAVYISNNSGANWIAANPAGGTTGYRAVTVSADGTTITAACNNARIYTSTDGGTTWTSSQPVPSGTAVSWQAMAASADGAKLVLASTNYEYIFTSIDKGATWTPHNVAGDVRWYRDATMSADGKKIAVVAENDFVWTSSGTFLTVNPSTLTTHGGLVTTGTECAATNSASSAIASLTVGGQAATNITNLDGCNISFVSPPLAVGLYDIVITYSDASSVTHANMLAYIEPTITLGLTGDGRVDASLSVGGFGATLITATVVTDSPLGYKLDLSADDTDLICSESGRGSDIISAMTGSGSAISNDTWAYGLGSGPSSPADLPTTWRGMTMTDYTIDSYGAATAGRDSHVYFGAKVTVATPSCDSYDGEVTFTAIAN